MTSAAAALRSAAAGRLGTAAAVTAAVVAFVAVWTVLHHGFYGRNGIVDTPHYQHFGDAIAGGAVPYRDVRIEYPPAALPLFVLPALGDGGASATPEERWSRFSSRYDLLLEAIGAAGVAAAGAAAAALGASRRKVLLVAGAAALLPLALGSVVLTRFDLWPAALVAGALALVLAGRPRWGLGVLGVAVAAKVYPVAAAPLLVAWVWRTRGRREGAWAAAAGIAATAACILPWVVVAPHGIWWSLTRESGRPLQVESLGAGAILALDAALGTGFHMVASVGSHNLVGRAARGAAAALAAVQVATVVALWLAFLRGPAERGRLIRLVAAALCAWVAFGKVLSPQYLVWLFVPVALVPGRRGLRALAVLGAACVLTQLWFPSRYWDLVAPLIHNGAKPDGVAVALVLARDLVLVGLLWLLAGDELRGLARAVVRRLRDAARVPLSPTAQQVRSPGTSE